MITVSWTQTTRQELCLHKIQSKKQLKADQLSHQLMKAARFNWKVQKSRPEVRIIFSKYCSHRREWTFTLTNLIKKVNETLNRNIRSMAAFSSWWFWCFGHTSVKKNSTEHWVLIHTFRRGSTAGRVDHTRRSQWMKEGAESNRTGPSHQITHT